MEKFLNLDNSGPGPFRLFHIPKGKKRRYYFRGYCAIGPMCGGTREEATTFLTARQTLGVTADWRAMTLKIENDEGNIVDRFDLPRSPEVAKTRKKLNRAKHNQTGRAIGKRMAKEAKDKIKKDAREKVSKSQDQATK